uniref:hypothetical protein n=1 Tax=Piscirickettsia salmonis TaxID=1238 RepID=UPI0039F70CF8
MLAFGLSSYADSLRIIDRNIPSKSTFFAEGIKVKLKKNNVAFLGIKGSSSNPYISVTIDGQQYSLLRSGPLKKVYECNYRVIIGTDNSITVSTGNMGCSTGQLRAPDTVASINDSHHREKRCAGWEWVVKGTCPLCVPWPTCPEGGESTESVANPGYKYPVAFMPWLADLKSWRSYDPASLAGVGVLQGMIEERGREYVHYKRLIGYQLHSNNSEYLVPGVYIYVYRDTDDISVPHKNAKEGGESILYYKVNESDIRNRLRHSQLGSGKSVYCAGEFVVSASYDYRFTEITKVDDASGHYKPQGKYCLEGVTKKLQSLNVNMDNVQISFAQP